MEEVSATGSVHTFGKLDPGFSLRLYSDSNFQNAVSSTSNFFIGNSVFVSLDWDIQPLENFKFFISQCSIRIEGEKVDIIQKNCYASALGTKLISSEHLVERHSRFQFVSFMTQQTARSGTQTSYLECQIKICAPNSTICHNSQSRSLADSDCPTSSSYSYTLTGH